MNVFFFFFIIMRKFDFLKDAETEKSDHSLDYVSLCEYDPSGDSGTIYSETDHESADKSSDENITAKTFHREVRIKSEFLQIDEIDTIRQRFSAVVFIRARWREPALDYDSTLSIQDDAEAARQLWNPEMRIANLTTEHRRDMWLDIERDVAGNAHVIENIKIKGTFEETMELEAFPFDVQDLSILVTTNKSNDEVELREDKDDISKIDVMSFTSAEWSLRQFVQVQERTVEDKCSVKDFPTSGLYFRCCVCRKSTFFILSMSLMMIISTLSFTIFAVPCDQPIRIELTLILILSSVNFKFSESNNIPHIPYLTHMDRYVIGSMLFLFIMCIWHAHMVYMNTSPDRDDQSLEQLDRRLFYVFVLFYLLLHITFVTSVYIMGRKRRNEIFNREKEYLARLLKFMASPSQYARKSQLNRISSIAFNGEIQV